MIDRPAWEYHITYFSNLHSMRQVESYLAEAGRSGWELVQMVPGRVEVLLAVFKRPALAADNTPVDNTPVDNTPDGKQQQEAATPTG